MRPAGFVTLLPSMRDRLYVGADDGRILAMELATGAVRWEEYVTGGVTRSDRAPRPRLCRRGRQAVSIVSTRRNGRRSSGPSASARSSTGSIAVDDERVYFAALDNVIRAARSDQWEPALEGSADEAAHRAAFASLGHVVFVPVAGAELVMLFDRDGARSGAIALPGETSRDAPPSHPRNRSGAGRVRGDRRPVEPVAADATSDRPVRPRWSRSRR